MSVQRAPVPDVRGRAPRVVAWLLLLNACWLWACTAHASAPAAGHVPDAMVEARELDDEAVRQWFERMHVAARESNYQGTLVSSADGVMSSARVAHFCQGRASFERVQVLDGRMQQTYRHNDRVVTLWPSRRIAVIEQRDPRTAPLRELLDARAQEQYRVQQQGTARVAGRDAVVLLLSPRDDLRFAQRLWVDAQTALVLRTDVLGPQQQVLESSAFSQVEIGVPPRPQTVLRPMRRLAGWQQVRPEQHATRLETEGWSLEVPVPGFRLTGCARRVLDPVDANGSAAVLQAVYSDGLTHVSLFIEALGGHEQRRPLQGHSGATYTLMQPYGGQWWITAVGDVPLATLRQFAQALQRRP